MAAPSFEPARVAYFSMEIALSDELPTYSGGLGVLAGDHLRAAADAGLPIVGLTLIYHSGFFRQEIDDQGRQQERPVSWSPEGQLERLDAMVAVALGGRTVEIGAWRLVLTGVSGHQVPVYFLDTRFPANDPWDQAITDHLYTGDRRVRLSQEAVLGLGGTAFLGALGYDVDTFHMNEGHASLVPVGLLSRRLGEAVGEATEADIDDVRSRCVFTTHTPVPAGHDRFDNGDVDDVLGPTLGKGLAQLGCYDGHRLNMTELGMFFAHAVNGVSRRHGEVSRAMFPHSTIGSVTNGVHVGTWAVPSTQVLFDRYIPRWRQDNTMLRYASSIPLAEMRAAHAEAKRALLAEVAARSGAELDPNVLTIGVARRAAAYKRNDLLVSDPEALGRLVDAVGPVQVLYSGKAHPLDGPGKDMIARVTARAKQMNDVLLLVYLEDYGLELARLLCGGVDLWLNTPIPPHEASGTSGMKAAVNGVPSLSTLDGWWLEGHVEGVTGWAIGTDPGAGPAPEDEGLDVADAAAAAELYRVLGEVVAPLYYEDPDGFAAVGRSAMALNGSFFSAQRMVSEYAVTAYRTGSQPPNHSSKRSS